MITVVYPKLRYFCRGCFFGDHGRHNWFNCECPTCTTQTTAGRHTSFCQPAAVLRLIDGDQRG